MIIISQNRLVIMPYTLSLYSAFINYISINWKKICESCPNAKLILFRCFSTSWLLFLEHLLLLEVQLSRCLLCNLMQLSYILFPPGTESLRKWLAWRTGTVQGHFKHCSERWTAWCGSVLWKKPQWFVTCCRELITYYYLPSIRLMQLWTFIQVLGIVSKWVCTCVYAMGNVLLESKKWFRIWQLQNTQLQLKRVMSK